MDVLWFLFVFFVSLSQFFSREAFLFGGVENQELVIDKSFNSPVSVAAGLRSVVTDLVAYPRPAY